MTTKRTTPRGAPQKRSKSPGEAALARAFAEQRRTVLTRDTFLKSQGPPAIPLVLPNLDLVVLMRRVDLFELARQGGEHWPLRSAVLGMIRDGGLTDPMLAGDRLAETLDIAAAVARATIVVPPAEFILALEADDAAYEADLEAWQEEFGSPWQDEIMVALAAKDQARVAKILERLPSRRSEHVDEVLPTLEVATLKPLFVDLGEEPDDDQVVLRWVAPDADPDDEDLALASGAMHWADLIVILRAAHRYGPGALGRRFRGDEPATPALAPLLDLAGGGTPAERADGAPVPVGGDGPGRGRGGARRARQGRVREGAPSA